MPPSSVFDRGRVHCQCWDLEGFGTWPQCAVKPRVVRSEETRQVRRQLDKKMETCESQWAWVTTLPSTMALTRAVVSLGHSRWDIENQGFNELVNRWHADHIYRHEPTAILALWLLTMLAATLFAAFYSRNLKPALRAACDTLQIARMMLTEVLHDLPAHPQAP